MDSYDLLYAADGLNKSSAFVGETLAKVFTKLPGMLERISNPALRGAATTLADGAGSVVKPFSNAGMWFKGNGVGKINELGADAMKGHEGGFQNLLEKTFGKGTRYDGELDAHRALQKNWTTGATAAKDKALAGGWNQAVDKTGLWGNVSKSITDMHAANKGISEGADAAMEGHPFQQALRYIADPGHMLNPFGGVNNLTGGGAMQFLPGVGDLYNQLSIKGMLYDKPQEEQRIRAETAERLAAYQANRPFLSRMGDVFHPTALADALPGGMRDSAHALINQARDI